MGNKRGALKVLYCGDSPVGGPANYLLGILGDMKAETKHVPPGISLTAAKMEGDPDVVIFSDYGKSQVGTAAQRKVQKLIQRGTGFLMVGGWGSFTGVSGGWAGSVIEEMLPVTCLDEDDRLNCPGGACILQKQTHPMVEAVSFKNAPVICGFNDIRPKENSEVILCAQKILSVGNNLTLDPVEHPLLVATKDTELRTAALATDLAPHWCGGLVDWGMPRKVLKINRNAQVEVGQTYIDFVAGIIQWLAGGDRK